MIRSVLKRDIRRNFLRLRHFRSIPYKKDLFCKTRAPHSAYSGFPQLAYVMIYHIYNTSSLGMLVKYDTDALLFPPSRFDDACCTNTLSKIGPWLAFYSP